MVKKAFSFVAGLMSGSIVGATVALLLTPQSGDELRAEARSRWEEALAAAEEEMEETRREKELEFERMKAAGRLR